MPTFDALLEKLGSTEQPGDDSNFVKHRHMVQPLLKDFRRSQTAKHNWNTPFNLKDGINKWHKSPEGKRFHRKLGRFLVTRDTDARNTFDTLLGRA